MGGGLDRDQEDGAGRRGNVRYSRAGRYRLSQLEKRCKRQESEGQEES